MQTLKKKFEHYKKEIITIKSFYNDCSGQKKGKQNKRKHPIKSPL